MSVAETIVAVRDLAIDALIGVNPEERGRRQRLIISVEAVIGATGPTRLDQTLDYCAIVAAAHDLAGQHVELIEEYARLLGGRCLALGPVARATVTVAKPGAIADAMAAASVTIERPATTTVLPFARKPRGGDRALRFRFEPDINPEAQRKLTWLIRQLAESIHGVDLGSLTYDAGSAEWTAHLTLGERRAPHLADSRDGLATPRRDTQ